ncbi:hypothetical protein HAD_13079 [Hyphomonas adhaerens MHS-3]|uniref:DUF4258 domain-containing protein n=1 Tax=Hyphomonas adhaerens MHS-3 TaxID=1280949 RepID=A0A069E1F4_9PROT|nr:hypothetical protein HAD_13079 [Hyphomonas adhaerens MHS-3]
MSTSNLIGSFQTSRHAEKRKAQRSIPEMAIELLVKFGSSEPSYDQTERLYFSDRDWKRVKRYFGAWMPNKSGQLRELCLVLAQDGTIITVAHAH